MTEHYKKQILSGLTQLTETDFSKNPAVYFLKRFQKHLRNLNLPSEVVETAMGLELNLSGLGMEAKPHQEFLDEAAQILAQITLKAYSTFKEEGLPFTAFNAHLKRGLTFKFE